MTSLPHEPGGKPPPHPGSSVAASEEAEANTKDSEVQDNTVSEKSEQEDGEIASRDLDRGRDEKSPTQVPIAAKTQQIQTTKGEGDNEKLKSSRDQEEVRVITTLEIAQALQKDMLEAAQRLPRQEQWTRVIK